MRLLSFLFVLAFSCSFLFAAAPTGDGVAFDGNNGFRVDTKDVKLDPKGFSVAAWVRAAKTDGSQMFVSLGKPAEDFTLYLYQNNVRMLVEHSPKGGGGPGSSYDFALAPPPKPGTWTHYLGTYDGETISVYVNGEKKASKKAPCKRDAFKLPLYIGVGPEQGRGLVGSMEDVQLWNCALSADEVKKVYGGEVVADKMLARWTALEKKNAEWSNAVDGGPKAVAFSPTVAEKSTASGSKDIELMNQKDDGYRGIWYHNQKSNDEYVYKYSGGLGTYPANHYPFAAYAPAVDKTFFCYGGARPNSDTALIHEVSYYDHKTGTVPKPTILLDKQTDDAHDNPVMNIDDDGYIWIFSTSHGTGRPSFIHKSKKPYDVTEFERIAPTKLVDGKEVPLDNFSYLQIYHLKGKGFGAMFTTYDKRVLNDPKTISQRTLCSMSSPDGVKWTAWRPFAGIEYGQYQSTGTFKDEKIGSSFNFHPNDKEAKRVGLNYRSNLYYMETKDLGETWQNAQGDKLDVPLKEIKNKALVHDYYAEGLNVYIMDVNFDAKGNPIVLYLTSKGYESGPKNDPRLWNTAYWTGTEWKIKPITESDNNYDFGSLYVEDGNVWRIIGTTGSGPQAYNTGGEVAVWVSKDSGNTWTKERQLTSNSEFNHCYPRRPVDAHPDFYALWASGHGRQPSPSTLYFCNKNGDVFELPRKMDAETQKPKKVFDR